MALANTHQAHAAQSTVASTRAQLANAEAQLKEAEVRLGYTKVYAPVSGTVSVRAAREGEVLTAGQPIVTIVDFGDTWVRAAIPETQADHIGIGDTLRIRLPGGTVTSGKVFFKSPEADFATQRDVSRRKRDIKTIVLKVRLDNPKGAYAPGMTADVNDGRLVRVGAVIQALCVLRSFVWNPRTFEGHWYIAIAFTSLLAKGRPDQKTAAEQQP